MAVTRLGWDILEPSSSRLTNLPWVTGKCRSGDAHVILEELGRRFNAEVERITKAHSWGYAKRQVRGATVASEHSAGVAVDFNAPKHGLGATGTFSKAQVKAIHKILRELDYSVRWGGDYAGRKDEMHFELVGGTAKLKKVADKLRAGKKPNILPKPKPKAPQPSAKATDKDLKIQQRLKAMGLYKRSTDGVNGKYQKAAVKAFQKAHNLVQGGNWGDRTEAKYQDNVKLQKALNLMKSTTPKLTVDGYLGKPTERRILDVLKRNAWSRRDLTSKLKDIGAWK